jgi:ABC-type uncharacterized transport system substrate-binding protein
VTCRRVLLVLACGLAGLTTIVVRSPLSLAAEPSQRVARVGFVAPLSPSTIPRYEKAFWERLQQLGWVKGQNLVIEEHSAEGHLDRLPALIAEVIDRKVDVLVTYGTAGAIAARKATSTVPIVAWALHDPVRTGLAASLARPGSNLTGLSGGYAEGLSGKFLELLQDAVPRLSTVAVIVNPNNPLARDLTKDLEVLAPTRALKLEIIELRSSQELNRTFEQARRKAQAVVVLGQPITLENMARVTALAAKHRLPSIYLEPDNVVAGGLIAYGADLIAMNRRAADYVDQILKGAKPGDLPIEQPSKFVLVVNLKTAKALGITIPESILIRADEVIR